MSASRITSNRIKKATAGEMLKGGPPNRMQQQQQQQQPIPKLSISDAIALITLRLGKVESILEKNNDSEDQFLTNYDDVILYALLLSEHMRGYSATLSMRFIGAG